jgi:hypothetical protein
MKLVVEDPGRKRRTYGQKIEFNGHSTPASTATSSKETPLITSAIMLSRTPSPLSLPQSCIETAYRAQSYSVYFDAYPTGGKQWSRLNTDWSVVSSTAWMQTAAMDLTTDVLLNDALTALTLAQLEHINGYVGSYNSRMLYGKAMRELATRLRTEDSECFSDATLAGVMALTKYELQGGTLSLDKKGWLSHVQGASSLIRFRGSRNFDGQFAEHLYLGAQLNELLRAIGRRKGGTQPSSDWLQLYSPRVGKQSSALQLFEILHDLPVIIDLADSIGAHMVGRSQADILLQLQAVAARAQLFELQLQAWYAQLESEQPAGSPLFWQEPSSIHKQLPEGHPSRVFPYFLCFKNVALAEQVVLHWTVLLHVTLLLGGTATDLGLPFDSAPKTLSNPIQLAYRIVQSLEYFLHPDMGISELEFIGFPMNLTLAFFRNIGGKGLAFYEVIAERLRETKSGLGDFLADMVGKGGGLAALRLLVA